MKRRTVMVVTPAVSIGSAVIKIILTASLLVGLPLLGVAMAGKPVAMYLEFPPLTRYVEHAPFSDGVFVGLAVVTVVTVAPFFWRAFFVGPATISILHVIAPAQPRAGQDQLFAIAPAQPRAGQDQLFPV